MKPKAKLWTAERMEKMLKWKRDNDASNIETAKHFGCATPMWYVACAKFRRTNGTMVESKEYLTQVNAKVRGRDQKEKVAKIKLRKARAPKMLQLSVPDEAPPLPAGKDAAPDRAIPMILIHPDQIQGIMGALWGRN